jgi:DNA-binding GntR family transcriptional regulator
MSSDAQLPNGLEGLGAVQIKRSSTAEQVVEALRAKIVAGEIRPGQSLPEAAMASSLSVSRNTMREALRLLTREGLAVHHLHRGAIVVRMTTEDVEDIFRVRRALELAAVEATGRASTVELAGLDAAVDQMASAADDGDLDGVVEADRLFHQRLVGVINSERLDRFYGGIQTEMRLCLAIIDSRDEAPAVVVDEHRELADLILAGERVRCRELMKTHLAEAEAALLEITTNQDSDDVRGDKRIGDER